MSEIAAVEDLNPLVMFGSESVRICSKGLSGGGATDIEMRGPVRRLVTGLGFFLSTLLVAVIVLGCRDALSQFAQRYPVQRQIIKPRGAEA